jgi:hypothetical protein
VSDFTGPGDDYNEVDARIKAFRIAYPDGCLRPADLAVPYRIETIHVDDRYVPEKKDRRGNVAAAHTVPAHDEVYIVYVAAAYRTPDDPCPGIGAAWEPFPGLTQFTLRSELQNAETSAWGRALVAVGAADARGGVASANERRNRQAEHQQAQEETPPTEDGPLYVTPTAWSEWAPLRKQLAEARPGALSKWANDQGWDLRQPGFLTMEQLDVVKAKAQELLDEAASRARDAQEERPGPETAAEHGLAPDEVGVEGMWQCSAAAAHVVKGKRGDQCPVCRGGASWLVQEAPF